MKTFFVPLLIFTIIASCSNTAQQMNLKNTQNQKLKTAYFASGCFWCAEAIYESLDGVTDVVSGYAGGHTQNPTYESSNTGTTGHAEAIKVTYNPTKISFSDLIDIYFASQDPTQVNGQGNDKGSQYRSILFYENDIEKQIIINKKEALSKKINAPIAAEIQEFKVFLGCRGISSKLCKATPQSSLCKGCFVTET